MKKINLIKATLADRSVIENMWPYYVYDLTRYCGFIKGWESPTELSFKSDDLTKCFTDPDNHVFMISIDNQHAGFVFVKKLDVMPEVDWFMSEFFIISKFQRSGIGQAVANEIFEKLPGEWAVGVLPENTGALKFWRKIITKYTHGDFSEVEKTSEELKNSEHLDPYPMIMMRFKTSPRGVDRKKNMISFVEKLPLDIEKKMERGLEEYAISHGIDVDYQPFAFILFDEKNEVIGVLDAFSSYSSIHIRDIWVDKAHRGKGYGRKLITALENHFKGKGLYNINLITCAYQAPEFYKKCGFEVEFVRENIKNPKLTMTFFIKYFEIT